jgi:hypothetical protein
MTLITGEACGAAAYLLLDERHDPRSAHISVAIHVHNETEDNSAGL